MPQCADAGCGWRGGCPQSDDGSRVQMVRPPSIIGGQAWSILPASTCCRNRAECVVTRLARSPARRRSRARRKRRFASFARSATHDHLCQPRLRRGVHTCAYESASGRRSRISSVWAVAIACIPGGAAATGSRLSKLDRAEISSHRRTEQSARRQISVSLALCGYSSTYSISTM